MTYKSHKFQIKYFSTSESVAFNFDTLIFLIFVSSYFINIKIIFITNALLT
jgi:hypothetical protein